MNRVILMSKPTWKQHLPVLIPNYRKTGLVHVVYFDNTENVLDASEVDWDAGWEGFDSNYRDNISKRIICYAQVTAEYQAEFQKGGNRAVDDLYRATTKLLDKILADENQTAETLREKIEANEKFLL
jgi:hypothetical protein